MSFPPSLSLQASHPRRRSFRRFRWDEYGIKNYRRTALVNHSLASQKHQPSATIMNSPSYLPSPVEPGPFRILHLPLELVMDIVELAIPIRDVQMQPDRTGVGSPWMLGDELDLRAVENLRLTCKRFNDIVTARLEPGFVRPRALPIAGNLFHKQTKVIRFDLRNNFLRVFENALGSPWIGQEPGVYPVEKLLSQRRKINSSMPPIPFNSDPRTAMFPNLKQGIVSVRKWENSPKLDWPEPIGPVLPAMVKFLKPITEPTLETFYGIVYGDRFYVQPWTLNRRWSEFALYPILQPSIMDLKSLVKDEGFLSLRGYSKSGSSWAGFYYSTRTSELFFTPLECRHVAKVFGLHYNCTSRLCGCEERAPTFVGRLWIDPSESFVAQYNWIPVRAVNDKSSTLEKQIAQLWTAVRTLLLDRMAEGPERMLL